MISAEAIGKSLAAGDMAKLCGLEPGKGADMIRRWEVTGPSGPAAELLKILAMASDRHPILDNFNVFDRFNIAESERPARRQAFRESMRERNPPPSGLTPCRPRRQSRADFRKRRTRRSAPASYRRCPAP